ncbi:hypothetical protein TNCV_3976171 [Trichonephila clavipes]|nr:hypothetical protein TNCV_3976171 [Trichonephila clavipes]
MGVGTPARVQTINNGPLATCTGHLKVGEAIKFSENGWVLEQAEREAAHKAAETPEQSQARRRHTFGYAMFSPRPALRGLLTRF